MTWYSACRLGGNCWKAKDRYRETEERGWKSELVLSIARTVIPPPEVPTREEENTIYQLKITLYIEPPIWRRIRQGLLLDWPSQAHPSSHGMGER
jgi:hypothetical protein